MISACCSAFGQAGGGRIKYPAIPGPELVLCLENKVNKSPCGADVRTDVPAAAGQNPGCKSLLRPLSLGFRKGKRAKGYAFVHIRKADFLAICIVRSPGAQDAPPLILAGPAVWASAPGTRLRFCPLIPGTRRRGVAGQKQEVDSPGGQSPKFERSSPCLAGRVQEKKPFDTRHRKLYT